MIESLYRLVCKEKLVASLTPMDYAHSAKYFFTDHDSFEKAFQDSFQKIYGDYVYDSDLSFKRNNLSVMDVASNGLVVASLKSSRVVSPIPSYDALLSISQSDVDLDKAGYFLNLLLNKGLSLVKEEDFLISHSVGLRVLSSGQDLVDRLNVSPKGFFPGYSTNSGSTNRDYVQD